jgi:hypothetical protein
MIGTLRISIRKIYSICTKGQTNQNKYFYGYPVIKIFTLQLTCISYQSLQSSLKLSAIH